LRARPRSSSPILAWLIALLLGGLSNAAFAVVPRIVGTPVVENPEFGGVPNTMMYDVTVTVSGYANDADHAAVVGFTTESDYTTCNATTTWTWAPTQTFDTTATRTWRLWNFQPGTTYYYKARVGRPGMYRSTCGVLSTTEAPTPTVPPELAALEIQYAKSGDPFYTKYVLMETDDCGASAADPRGADDYLVVLDPENETIVWYLDIPAVSGIDNATAGGWRYQPGTTTTSGRILMLIGHRYMFEWTFDGRETNYYDFGAGGECDNEVGSRGPCVHHDAFRSDYTGRTYALSSELSSQDGVGTEWESACGEDANFVDDGYVFLNPRNVLTGQRSLMVDWGWDPTIYGGPHAAEAAADRTPCEAETFGRVFDPRMGVIDWTHANALHASRVGPVEVLDFSLKEWDAVVRINAQTGARLWTLAGNASDSDWTLAKDSAILGRTDFSDQHDVHAVGNDLLMMFDNQGSPVGSRVLRLTLDSSTATATIDRSWMLVDASGSPLYCPLEGSGRLVPGSSDANVLANCNDENTMVELNDATGAVGTAPPLVISLPSPTDFCSSGGPSNSNELRGWHRAFPIENLGNF
jgi:hypothetical protein